MHVKYMASTVCLCMISFDTCNVNLYNMNMIVHDLLKYAPNRHPLYFSAVFLFSSISFVLNEERVISLNQNITRREVAWAHGACSLHC